jgi:hypothetical protein
MRQEQPTSFSTKFEKKHPGAKIFSFVAGVNDTGDQPLPKNISAIFIKNRNCFSCILRGLGETDGQKSWI